VGIRPDPTTTWTIRGAVTTGISRGSPTVSNGSPARWRPPCSLLTSGTVRSRRLRRMTTYWGPDFAALQEADPEIADVVLDELARLRGGLQLIASENLTSPAVLAALGSTLTNKYAEGYPGRRYYGGCAEVDRAE